MLIVLATENRDKGKEIRSILREEIGLEIKTLADFPHLKLPPETGQTYRDNAMEKALFVAKQTGHVALGDDSGLEVDALGGAPGLYSARFAGENVRYIDNCEKLIDALKDFKGKIRGAKFFCTVAIASPQGSVRLVDGVCPGEITESLSGNQGFGYDPIFFYPPLKRTFSELSFTEKNQHSHRGMALRAAIPILKEMSCQKV